MLSAANSYIESFRPSLSDLIRGATWKVTQPDQSMLVKKYHIIPRIKENIYEAKWGIIGAATLNGVITLIAKVAAVYFTGPLVTSLIALSWTLRAFTLLMTPLVLTSNDNSNRGYIQVPKLVWQILGQDGVKALPCIDRLEDLSPDAGITLFSPDKYFRLNYIFQYHVSNQPGMVRESISEGNFEMTSSQGAQSQIGTPEQLAWLGFCAHDQPTEARNEEAQADLPIPFENRCLKYKLMERMERLVLGLTVPYLNADGSERTDGTTIRLCRPNP